MSNQYEIGGGKGGGNKPVKSSIDQIAEEAASKVVREIYDEEDAYCVMEQVKPIIQSAIEKQREIDFGWLRKMFKDTLSSESGSPATASELESIVASCTCLTKTPEVKYHAESCRYRKIMESHEAVGTFRKPDSASTYKVPTEIWIKFRQDGKRGIEAWDFKPWNEDQQDVCGIVHRFVLSATPSGGITQQQIHSLANLLVADSTSLNFTQLQSYEAKVQRWESIISERITPSGGGKEKWTEETVTEIIVDAFNSAGEVRPSQLIAERHNATLQPQSDEFIQCPSCGWHPVRKEAK